MKNWKFTFFAVLLTGVLSWSVAGAAKDPDKANRPKRSLSKTAGVPQDGSLSINNLTAWFHYDGESNHSPGGDNGLYFPRGTGNAIYQDGVVWGAKAFVGGFQGTGTAVATQPVRVGGGTYGVGTRAGWVNGIGATATPISVSDPDVRVYRIRRDYSEMTDSDLRADAAAVEEIPQTEVTDQMMAAIQAQYALDWVEWGTKAIPKGAPYIERNGTPGFQAPPAFDATFTVDSLISQNQDEPGVAGIDPNSPADQVIWLVYNDLNVSSSQSFEGSDPLGLEVQKTVWGYKSLNNLYFSRYRFINKGGVDVGGSTGSFHIDSMYVCQWSDPDLGSFSDDLVGCDTTLSMGFVYNANPIDGTYRAFNLPPPAAGYDFLAGPIVASTGATAVFDLKYKPDYRNLGMSSFAYFSAGSPYSDPPGDYQNGSGRWWKMLRGFAPLGDFTTADQPYAFPDVPSKFPLSGDPVAGTGWIDGEGEDYSFVTGDRRLLVTTGPFQMAPGDTQDIVIGFVAGLGSDRKSSVAVMKFNDEVVQNTFDALFQVPSAPAAPDVKIAEMDGQLILEWASNNARTADTEGRVVQPGTFVFEGYNVYQLPSAGSRKEDGIRIATYDLPTDPTVILNREFDIGSGQILDLPVQFGTNSGIKRDLVINRDYVKDINKLYNGQEYYFAVTAYSRSTIPGYLPAALESAPIVLTARPKVPFGKVYETAYGDVLTATHTAGSSDGSVVPVVVNPTVSTGQNYEVSFDTTGGTKTWTLRNTTTTTVLLSGQTNESGDDEYAITDGIRVKVLGPPLQGKSYTYASASPANFSPVAVAEQAYTGGRWFTGGGHGGELFFGGVFMEPNFLGPTTLSPADYKVTEIRFSPMQSYTDLTGDGEYTIGEPYVVTGPHTQGAFMYGAQNDAASYQGFNPIPFTAWDVSNPSSPVQLNVVIRDRDLNGQWDMHADNTGVTNAAALPLAGDLQFNYTWITNTPYDATGTYYGDGTGGTINFWGPGATQGGMWVMWVDDRGSGGMLAEESFFTLTPNFVNTVADVYTFSAPAASAGQANELASIDRVGVFPNPYYAFNAAETNRFNRFVTFNNLPPRATIRIFNLAGQLVRRIDKDDTSQFTRWNLANNSNFPVASGMYVAHLEMTLPGDNSVVTKVLKIAVIQEQEILNSF